MAKGVGSMHLHNAGHIPLDGIPGYSAPVDGGAVMQPKPAALPFHPLNQSDSADTTHSIHM
ncbi:hypothetical protein EYF80_031561 [Liparis tanakae]|uniref:Uncharacterized protein n=1 Tax=Liparis tanakae TaxID=230148 RepID=A0A4Z2GY22_9TELE|nr:hypothetical protein EYF80_031561 [Liparis tanakae]